MDGKCGATLRLCDEAYSVCDNGGVPRGLSAGEIERLWESPALSIQTKVPHSTTHMFCRHTVVICSTVGSDDCVQCIVWAGRVAAAMFRAWHVATLPDLCSCDCEATAHYGPQCADTAPPPVMCGAGAGTPQVGAGLGVCDAPGRDLIFLGSLESTVSVVPLALALGVEPVCTCRSAVDMCLRPPCSWGNRDS